MLRQPNEDPRVVLTGRARDDYQLADTAMVELDSWPWKPAVHCSAQTAEPLTAGDHVILRGGLWRKN